MVCFVVISVHARVAVWLSVSFPCEPHLPGGRFLSSEQSLADYAGIHALVVSSYNLTHANKWVSFGGSYSGALSAWMRLKVRRVPHTRVACCLSCVRARPGRIVCSGSVPSVTTHMRPLGSTACSKPWLPILLRLFSCALL